MNVTILATRISGTDGVSLEAVFFKKPIAITPYSVYKTDIAPLDFDTILMPHKVTKKVVDEVGELLADKKRIKKMVDANYQLGKKYFSYQATAKKLKKIFKEMKLE